MKDKDKPKQALALSYRHDKDSAPRVVAKGAGFVAEQILSVAKQHDIPIYQNRVLAGMLMAVEIDREVPPELYQTVAEVLAHIYRLDQRMGERNRR